MAHFDEKSRDFTPQDTESLVKTLMSSGQRGGATF